MTNQQPTIIILGASFHGLPLAHKLLRSLPPTYKLILVNPSDQIYWNIASPRAVAKPGQFSPDDSQLFVPFLPALSHHPISRFEFLQGAATSLDPSTNTVTITTTPDDGTPGDNRSLNYTHLVIATGSSSSGNWPFKALPTLSATRAAISTSQSRIAAAQTIVISGGGPTGVETAGEIATLYKSAEKKVVLISSSARPLPAVREDVGMAAQRQLELLGVVVKNGVRVVEEMAGEDGRLVLTLSSGETLVADLHIPAFGLVPNTGFVPGVMLDEGGKVRVTKNLQSAVRANVWSLGEAAGLGYTGLMTPPRMTETVEKNILAVEEGKGEEAFVEYKNAGEPLLVPIGGGFAMGTGIYNGFRIWGFLVWLLKGRNFAIGNTKVAAKGVKFSDGSKI